MANLGTLTAHIGMNTAMLRADSMRAQGMLSRFAASGSKGIGAVTASVGKLSGALAALGVGIGAIQIFKSITQIGVEFEQTMTTVAGVMRATSEEMERLTEAARRMGETTEWTASQAGEALRFLGMAGFEANEAIEALPGVLDLATAGTLDLGRAADIASNALTAMQLPVKDLNRVNDVFIGTITRSNVNMEQMAEAFKYAAPVANAFGYSVEELSAMIGQLGNAGVQGSMAGTQLAMAMQRANEIAAKFGYTSADLLDVLESMAAEGRTNADYMDLFGQRAGRAALILKDMIPSTKEFQETLGGVAGEAGVLADKMRNTIGGAYKELKSVIESLKIDVFAIFRDDLKESIRSTTEWIRRNKEEIIAFARGIVDAFKIIWGAVELIWKVLSALVGGMNDVFNELATQSSAAVDQIEEDAARAEAAFKPPDFTPWDHFMTALNAWGYNIVIFIEAVAKSVGQVIAGLVIFIVNDLLKNLLEALWEFAGAIEKLMYLDFSGVWDQIKSTGSQFADMWNESDRTGLAMINSVGKAWEQFADKLELRAPATILRENWEKEQERLKAAGAPEIPEPVVPGAPTVHQPKAVSFGTVEGADDLEKQARAAEKAARAYERLVDTQVNVYRNLLNEEGRTKEEMLAVWDGYEAARREQIMLEAKALEEVGVSAELIAMHTDAAIRDLLREERELFDEHGEWMRGMVRDMAMELRSTMQEFFFDTMKGDWEDLTDYLEALWDAFLRRIADKAAQELMDIIGLGGGGGSPFGGFSLFSFGGGGGGGGNAQPEAMQSGGIVTSPRLAQIGEVPEAVIPLHKLRDDNFRKSLGIDPSEKEGDTYVTFHIQTPDLPTFKASQSQLMSQAAVALTQARRNM